MPLDFVSGHVKQRKIQTAVKENHASRNSASAELKAKAKNFGLKAKAWHHYGNISTEFKLSAYYAAMVNTAKVIYKDKKQKFTKCTFHNICMKNIILHNKIMLF